MASELESLDTTSTSLTEDSLNISFADINYTVRNGFLGRGRKVILDNISGQFNAGELTVIMGQSGAGKSCLMDILSGYTKPTSGKLYVNDRLRNEKKFRRRSCYILQDDKVQDRLTIRESLNIAAELKLGDHISRDQKATRVEEIITSLGLGKVRNTRAMYLSGGQRKRLAIGLELISDPPVMFLDEPTSGLDSSIAKQMVYLLHLLARQGRTVVVSIHQPSAALLQMVDKLYAVANGRCTYMGTVQLLLTYLETMDIPCPHYHNPVDFLIEISADHVTQLVENSGNGKSLEWNRDIITNETDDIVKYDLSNFDDVFLTVLPAPVEDPTSKILLAIKSTYATSRWKQLLTLICRSLLMTWRNPSYTLMVLGIHCGMALMVGCLFWNIGVDGKNVVNNYNLLYFCLMFLMFTAFSLVTVNFPQQLPVARREHFNRWYTTSAYFLSTFVSSLPTQTMCTLTFASLVYWMTGQPLELIRYVVFCFILLIVSYVSLCVGLLNGSLFNILNGVVFGPFFIMPFTIFSGFFLRYSDAPFLFRWIFHLSFLKHGLVGLMIAIFGMDRPPLKCSSDLYCHYRYLSVFNKDKDMEGEKLSHAVISILGIGLFVFITSYVILRIRLKRKW